MEEDLYLSNLSESERDEAYKKYQAFWPFLESRISLRSLSEQSGIPLTTLKRWLRRYKKGGLVGLARKTRSNKGESQKYPAEVRKLVEGLVLKNPNMNIPAIYSRVLKVCEREGWPQPGIRYLYKIVDNMSPDLLTLGLHGAKAYEDQFDVVIRRETFQPNEIWQADHCLLDIWILDEQNKPNRPWLTIVIDDFSRAIAGYFLTFDAPSALNTSLALHQAIWPKSNPSWHICGIPEVFYTDNGSDFKSNHLEQVAANIKMRLVFSIPGKPRGRGKIERFFETVNQMFLSKLPGYASDGKLASTKPVLTLKELDEQFLPFLLEVYHKKIHSTTKKPPQEKWEDKGFLPRLPESLEELDLLLLTVPKTRKIHPDGIKFQGFRYFSITLAPYVKEEVVIRYDPRDLAQIRVYYKNKFLCVATSADLEEGLVSLKDIISARRKQKRLLRQELKDRIEIADSLCAYFDSPDSDIPKKLEVPAKPENKKKLHIKRYHHE